MPDRVSHETIWLLWICVISATVCGISESLYSGQLARRIATLEDRVAKLEARAR